MDTIPVNLYLNDQSHTKAMQEQDRIWTLMARKLAGEATHEERKELVKLLHKYPDMSYTVEMLLN